MKPHFERSGQYVIWFRIMRRNTYKHSYNFGPFHFVGHYYPYIRDLISCITTIQLKK
jgi:hypothetical protein